MNIAIIDDTAVDRLLLSKTLKDYFASRGLDADISEFENAEAFLQTYRPLMYTIVFMDIYMKGKNGIEAATEFRKSDCDTLLVFLTSSGEHRPEAFSTQRYDRQDQQHQPPQGRHQRTEAAGGRYFRYHRQGRTGPQQGHR